CGCPIVGLVTGGDVIAIGPETVFEDLNINGTWATRLSSSSFGVMYDDQIASRAYVCTVSGLNITTGTQATMPVQLGPTYANGSIATLDDNTFIVACSDGLNGDSGTVTVGTVTGGDTISFGPGQVFNLESTQAMTVTARSANRIAVAYQDF